ncbi:MAG: GNAT family N-acetyltransferase [Pseudomonadales bacterium]|jgi:CelD/BcsL family acetyltransferase involved in cellulose biosynthesis|nr:GNAT family N-acetyltransferase [Pseudomonadales bacterium]
MGEGQGSMELVAGTQGGGVRFEVSSGLDDSLRSEWVALEARAEAPFFLSWHWIGTWLEVYQPNVEVLRAFKGSQLIGIALFTRFDVERHWGLLRSRTLRLHQTGDAREDQIWIEYNGLLVDRHHRDGVHRLVLDYLLRAVPDWDELIVGAVRNEDADLLAAHPAILRHDLWTAPCYGIDLDAIRRSGASYLDTLSRNTRYQVRRAQRLYEEQGAVELIRPASLNEALEAFEEIGKLHLTRWGSEAGRSGFANPEFMAFHRQLIQRHWNARRVDIRLLRVGGRLVSGFYNFLHEGVVYFYLSGVGNERESRLKPGLLGHALCIEHYLEDGWCFYDFMGGGERYKKSLGQVHQQLFQCSLQKRQLKFRLERAAREIKRRVQKAGKAST